MATTAGRFSNISGHTHCNRCGHDFGQQERGWQSGAVVSDQPMQGAGGLAYESPAAVRLRTFCCPGCARLLETQTTLSGQALLEDTFRHEDGVADSRRPAVTDTKG